MTDIVERLKYSLSTSYSELRKEAAIEIMRLRAKIAEMEQQELVATVIKEGDSRYWMSERLWSFPDGKYPLYALPGAQQPTLTPSAGAESRGCGSCKHWINERRAGDKEGSGSCDRVPMQWQAEPDDALAFVADGELYFAQLRTMPSFFCAHFEAVTPSAENSSTSPVERAAGPTASDLP